jgi:hypothetical protein
MDAGLDVRPPLSINPPSVVCVPVANCGSCKELQDLEETEEGEEEYKQKKKKKGGKKKT